MAGLIVKVELKPTNHLGGKSVEGSMEPLMGTPRGEAFDDESP
jgi:hypothetical protein